VLAELSQIDPINVYFTMSDSDLARFRANVRAARGQIYPENWPLWVGFGKEGGYPHRGKIDFAATSLSASTGTLLLRGVLPNPGGKILPGLFTRVRVPLQLETPALLVPQEAVDRDQSGAHVLVVDEKNLVKRLSVKTGAVVDHSEVIEEGLTGNEWIVVKGHLKAVPGKQVTPVREEVGTGRAGS
jgi:RND family efflux transporter MFP subunit